MHLFRETEEILYENFFAVIQYGFACKTSEDLMLIRADKLHICAGGSVYNRNEVHFKASIVTGEGPRRHVVLFEILSRNLDSG